MIVFDLPKPVAVVQGADCMEGISRCTAQGRKATKQSICAGIFMSLCSALEVMLHANLLSGTSFAL